MNRIAIFAHYDAQNSIQNYVIYYLEQLAKIFSTIIFVSDSNLKEVEIKKIDNIVQVCITKRHGEYDFGSYKIGFNYLLENNLLYSADEIAFINDSCYGPFYNLSTIFNTMEKKNNDFWGLSSNYSSVKKNKKHVQSFFVIFNKNVFTSQVFIQFINSIKKEDNKKEICIKYELGLTKTLENAGFKWNVYSNISKNYFEAYLYKFNQLIILEQYPLLKRSIVLNKEDIFIPNIYIKYLIKNYTNYDYNLIKQDIRLNRVNICQKKRIRNIIKRIFINIIENIFLFIRQLYNRGIW